MIATISRRLRVATAGALMIAVLAPAVASAQDVSDSHLTAARSAIAAIAATSSYDQILPGTAEQLKTRLISNNPNLDEEITTIVEDEALKLVSRRGDLENEAARAYASAFTEDELNAIAAFYQTDAGKKFIENGPIVAREVQKSAEVWARGIERDLLENVVTRMNDENLGANTDVQTPQQTIQEPEAVTPQN